LNALLPKRISLANAVESDVVQLDYGQLKGTWP
jgi:hypothetical protein